MVIEKGCQLVSFNQLVIESSIDLCIESTITYHRFSLLAIANLNKKKIFLVFLIFCVNAYEFLIYF